MIGDERLQNTHNIDENKMRKPLLQDYVVPICLAKIDSKNAIPYRFCGTAFFISDSGHFLTAKHVIENLDVDTHNGLMHKNFTTGEDVYSEFKDISFAPNGYDIAAGRINSKTLKPFTTSAMSDVHPWQDVATMGYPDTEIKTVTNGLFCFQRYHKGYVQSVENELKNELLSLNKSRHISYELNFPITQGMSGSPLFVEKGLKELQLIGVCVGSKETTIVNHCEKYTNDNGTEFHEKEVRFHQYGLAHSILPILDWKPEIYDGKSLRDILM